MPLFYEQFTAWISIDGCVADEYGVRVVNGDHDNGDGNSGDGGKGGIKEMGRGGNVPRVECWIPSVEGKTFTIHWTDSVRTTATDGIVRVDGKECGGKVLSPHKPESDACKVGWRISATEVRPFVFAKVGLTDDDTLAFPDVLHPHLGEIQIDIHKAIITTMSTEFNALEAQAQAIASEITNEDQNSTSTLTTVVHEKTKKMIEHHTRFGKPLSSARPAVRVTREPDSEPVVRFLFRYRSLDLLRAMGLVPLDQQPADTKPDSSVKKEDSVKAQSSRPSRSSNRNRNSNLHDSGVGIRTPEPTPKLELEDGTVTTVRDTKPTIQPEPKRCSSTTAPPSSSSPSNSCPSTKTKARRLCGRSSLPSSHTTGTEPSGSVVSGGHSGFGQRPLTPPRSESPPPTPSSSLSDPTPPLKTSSKKRKDPPEGGAARSKGLEGARRAGRMVNELLGLGLRRKGSNAETSTMTSASKTQQRLTPAPISTHTIHTNTSKREPEDSITASERERGREREWDVEMVGVDDDDSGKDRHHLEPSVKKTDLDLDLEMDELKEEYPPPTLKLPLAAHEPTSNSNLEPTTTTAKSESAANLKSERGCESEVIVPDSDDEYDEHTLTPAIINSQTRTPTRTDTVDGYLEKHGSRDLTDGSGSGADGDSGDDEDEEMEEIEEVQEAEEIRALQERLNLLESRRRERRTTRRKEVVGRDGSNCGRGGEVIDLTGDN